MNQEIYNELTKKILIYDNLIYENYKKTINQQIETSNLVSTLNILEKLKNEGKINIEKSEIDKIIEIYKINKQKSSEFLSYDKKMIKKRINIKKKILNYCCDNNLHKWIDFYPPDEFQDWLYENSCQVCKYCDCVAETEDILYKYITIRD